MTVICPTCGNEIPASSVKCRYCNSSQPRGRGARSAFGRRQIYTINLEAGLPTVQKGLDRLENELLKARRSGALLVRIIHGYGSKGVGGKIKEACRVFLNRKLAAGQIRGFLPGEDYFPGNPARRNLINRYPQLKSSERTDGNNKGITFVEF